MSGKGNEFKYAVRSGLQNIGRHPLLLVASITTLTLMLYVISLFSSFSNNASRLSDVAQKQPPLTVSMKISLTQKQMNDVLKYLESSRGKTISLYQAFTPEQNFEDFKKTLGNEDLWKDFNYQENIPFTFSIKLTDPKYAKQVKSELLKFKGVGEVNMESGVMHFLVKARNITTAASLILFVLLALISVLIVSNMIRVAALSRAAEINIMKYVGATNGFVQIPFIVEGVCIGIIGALLASLFAGLTYSVVYNHYNASLASIGGGIYSLIPTHELLLTMIIYNFTIGILLSLAATLLAVRRHVRV